MHEPVDQLEERQVTRHKVQNLARERAKYRGHTPVDLCARQTANASNGGAMQSSALTKQQSVLSEENSGSPELVTVYFM